MNWLDLLLIIILGLAGIMGFRKGLIAQVIMVVALLLGLWAVIHLSDWTARFLIAHFSAKPDTLKLWAFGITFALVVVLVYLAGRLASGILKGAMLGWLDKLGGLVLGILKMALLISVLFAGLAWGNALDKLVSPHSQRRSILYAPIRSFAPAVYPYLCKGAYALQHQLEAEAPVEQESDATQS